jgi:hypothetical protein
LHDLDDVEIEQPLFYGLTPRSVMSTPTTITHDYEYRRDGVFGQLCVQPYATDVSPARSRTRQGNLRSEPLNQIRHCFGAPTGGTPLFDRTLTLKKHECIFT